MTITVEAPQVYKAIAAIQCAMAKVGIAKNQKNTQQHYNFRGIDDVYGALAPLLSEHGLCILPRVMTHETTERLSTNQKQIFHTILEIEFDFVALADGSKHTICTVGEAIDYGDKSCNKAMSSAYKYACFQAFCIPTEGDNDSENNSPEVTPKGKPAAKPAARPSPPQPTPDNDDYDQQLGFGKNTGKTWRELAGDDEGRSYLEWLAKKVDDKTGKPSDRNIMAQNALALEDFSPAPGDPGMPLATDEPPREDDDIPF